MILLGASLACGAPRIGPMATERTLATAATTPVPAPTGTPAGPTSTPVPFVPFTGTSWADGVFLRSGPGYLFSQIVTMPKGTSLTIVGRSPGGEWLYAEVPAHQSGWVFAQLVDSGTSDMTRVPVVQPGTAQLIVGRVEDPNGRPISGIQFSLVAGRGADAPRNDAITDESGTFFAFMPLETTGTWLVSYTAVSCKSNTMDAHCDCLAGRCGRPEPVSLSIELPRPTDDVLEFQWR